MMMMSGPEADSFVLLLLAAAVGFAGMLFMLRAPKAAIIGWIALLAFVPIWWGVGVMGYWYPAALAGLGLVFVLIRDGSWGPVSAGDVGAAIFFIAALAPLAVSGAWSLSAVFVVVTQWLLAFLIGRLAPSVLSLETIYLTISVVFGAVAVLALVEFALSWNPFVGFGRAGPEYQSWGPIQYRGGLPRVEGAWGHSIALGSAMAMSIPLMLASRLRSGWKVLLLALMLSVAMLSFSRIAQLTAVLAVVLSIYALAPVLRRSVRVIILALLAVGAVFGYGYVTEVYGQSGDEFAKSAAYRADLTELIGEIAFFGQSSAVGRTAGGSLTFGDFQSIDNAMLLLGLKHGWLALLAAIGLAVCVLALTLLRKAEPPTVALASQIPTLFAVALITQFGMYLWFVAGLAVAAQALRRARTASGEAPDALPEPLRERDALIPA